MHILFISVYESVISYGLRCLSAVLKEANVPVKLVFLPRESEGFRVEGFQYGYAENVLDQIASLAQDVDLVGISVMSNYFENAVEITSHLHKTVKVPVIWGGIHPSIRPEECLDYADMICVGEGEQALLELVQKLDSGEGYQGIDNIWYKENGNVVRTPIRPLSVDLDEFPYPDYDMKGHYVLHQGDIQPMTEELLYYYLRWPYNSDQEPTYTTLMSRGCNWNCTYCNNNALRKIYQSKWGIRRRSVNNFVGELKNIITHFPGIKLIKIEDDVFVDDIDSLREFSELYTKTLKTPLWITGFQPPMVTEEKVSLLVNAGMKRVRMGMQTGSMDTLHKIYRRPGSMEQIRRACEIFNKFKDKIDPPLYDLILDNPWETEEDRVKTLELLLEIPKPYELVLFSLTFYPGTDLYERAKAEGLFKDDISSVYEKNYAKMDDTYINSLIRLMEFQNVPSWLVRLLARPEVRKYNAVFIPRLLLKISSFGRLMRAGWRAISRLNFHAFYHAVRVRIVRQKVKVSGAKMYRRSLPGDGQ